jgi:hypothetical protein
LALRPVGVLCDLHSHLAAWYEQLCTSPLPTDCGCCDQARLSSPTCRTQIGTDLMGAVRASEADAELLRLREMMR